ncbi:MAG: hypothetical protein ACP5LX_06595 [Nitrososphaeria archaeon]|nr:hypothetical protein [TACK group archaeon]
MSEDWFGDDHSPVSPSLSLSELKQIHKDGFHYKPAVLQDKEEAFRNAVAVELRFISEKFGSSGIRGEGAVREIAKRAKKVRGPVPLKVAVALYSLNLYEPRALVLYLKLRNIEKTEGRLYHYAYRSGLGRIRKSVSLEEVLSREPVARYIRPEHLSSVRSLFEKFQEELRADPRFMGRKPETIARIALIRAMESVGYEVRRNTR